jgi:hypothetical protein
MKHNTREQFVRDIDRGNEGTIKVKTYIYEKYGIKSIITDEEDNKREHIDIRILKKEHQVVDEKIYSAFIHKFGYKIEVKHDQTANKTGNIYLEIWSNVRINPPNPGAISQCRAHSIWYVLDKKLLVFDRALLFSCLLTHFYFDTQDAQKWKSITTKPRWQGLIKEHLLKYNSFVDQYGMSGNELKINLMPAHINSDVRGILVSIQDIERLKEKIGLIEVVNL